MNLLSVLVGAVGIVLLTAGLSVLSAAEAAVRLLSRGRTRRLLEAERRGAADLDAMMERPSRLSAGLAVWRGLAYSLGAAFVIWDLTFLVGGTVRFPMAVLAAVGTVAVVVSFGEALPRTLAVHNPERVGLAAAPAARRLSGALAPVGRLLAAGWVWMVTLVAEEPMNDAWRTGEESRVETPEDDDSDRDESEEAFIDAVMEFATKIVREVMVPRTDMVCVEDTATVTEAVAVIVESGTSRVPVYHETLDDIRGVLYAKDLLTRTGPGAPTTVAELAREAFFVPETKPVEELLFEMRQRKVHMALVADEYGGTAGLITIEDLLEEIVGEIFDEYDAAVPLVTKLEDGTLLLDARLPIDDLNDLVGTAIELEADSLGGLFVELAGHIPSEGESIVVEGVRITAREVDGTRIRRLLVEPTAEPTKEDADA